MRFDVRLLAEQLAALPSQRHRLAFAASVVERLLPNYQRFALQTGWGDAGSLRAGVDLAWRVAAGGTAPLAAIKEIQAKCRTATPNSEDFRTPLVSSAIDAAAAVHEALEVCFVDDPARIADIGLMARDTVDMFIQEREGIDYSAEGFEDAIRRHPLMQRELARQQDTIAELSNAKLGRELIANFRERAARRGSAIDPTVP